ncbi:hypothetical protein ABTX15_05600 [Micromonospora sp. NPDC094482]|uniref:hypothetical protein n=1 Tax=unclassified Micromonospora TaxID=2617518 RepID=UPI00332C810E
MFTHLVGAHATEVDQWLLRECASSKILAASGPPYTIEALLERDEPARQLALERLTAARISIGIRAAQETLRQLGQKSRHPAGVTRHYDFAAQAPSAQAEIDLWRNLTLLAHLGHDPRVERDGVLRRIERFARDNAESWARFLPWLLLVGPEIGDRDIVITTWLVEDHPRVVAALAEAAASPLPRVGLRACGIQARLDGGHEDTEIRAVNVLASQVDRRRDVFPRPLAGPAATWLGDTDLEDLVRGGTKAALRDFAAVVDTQGAAEEEGLTQRLLGLLERHLGELSHTLTALGGGTHQPSIALAQRTVPKAEERRIGADLGIVVTASVGGELHIRFGDVVQVKKSNLFTRPSGQFDSWRIEARQLRDLLAVNPTAAYWLVPKSGEVLVVPGKLLHAVCTERCHSGQRTFTVRHGDVRHAAIGLDQYLCDLTLGMWVGTFDPDKLALVDGTNSRTRPTNILEIRVRWIQG